MKWKLLARHIRRCPKCENRIQRKRKNIWSEEIKLLGKKLVGWKCENEKCDFFITNEKLRELAPSKKRAKANKLNA